ncbi:DUF3152 domain-containing protein [Modestobacter sp. I12A-02628]|uniref:DUF3152 domain-containing protein n=1 Tax=Goekera deserti TaxID=2497753 RepID=A0A7K3W9M0_9ACTN|nr:DUF3152 domain-containing protein [Goekera deserti]NDI49993.1 DUF3152 domain-containing protein [Goekera deserti]NEL52530.1 DUF3152 domain-containing protein [Goekera deserti]
MPPLPPRPAGARTPVPPRPRPRPDVDPDPASRTVRAAGPLVADRDPGRRRHAAAHVSQAVRLQRFARRHGWRAYAIPVLTVATFLALFQVARQPAPVDTPTDTAVLAAEQPGAADTLAAAEGEGAPVAPVPVPDQATGYVEKGAGTVSVVDGTSPVYGSGPLQRFVVEVEDGIEVDGPSFATAVEATLGDPRSWGAGGAMSFQRVGAADAAAGSYDFKVTLVSPGNMEVYCPGVGTGGYTSCRYGERAVVNLARWETAVPDYAGDIATYRQYVVNHEVGHALGNGHEECPGPGLPAPVMQQQTLGLEGCVKNAWPFP